jgi:hypothetical protein
LTSLCALLVFTATFRTVCLKEETRENGVRHSDLV